MIIPLLERAIQTTPSASATLAGHDSKPIIAGWSSLIGIVVAIVGNIFISFALNIQRYAHVRLEKEQQDEENGYHNDRGPGGGENGHDAAVQSDIADKRAKANWKSPRLREGNNYSYHDGEGAETDPLIPSLHRKDSHDSTSTAQTDEKSSENITRKSYLKSPYWWIGITLMTIGEAGNFLAYGFAPASIVSPLGVVALISNCLIAPIMLKERFRKRDLGGVIIAVGGAVTIVLSAQGSNPKLGPHQIWRLITRWEFLTYLGITVFLIILLMVMSNKYGGKTILIDIGLVGLFGGYTALATKGVASLLSYRLWHALTFPITYLLVAVLVFTAIMQIKYVNRALQRFNSTQVIPTQFVMFTIFVIVGSAVLYRDFEQATPASIAQFVGGCVLTFFGVWCITSGRDNQNSEEDNDMDEEAQIDMADEETQQWLPKDAYNAHNTPSPPSTRRENSYSTPQSSLETPKISKSSSEDSPSSFATAASRIPPSTPTPLTLQPPRLQTTSSSPLLPSESHISLLRIQQEQQQQQQQSQLLTTNSPQPSPRRPHTPAHARSDFSISSPPRGAAPDPTPRTSAHRSTTPAPRMLSRNSLANIFPGPLTSPLSAGLSAIVADNLRRGNTKAARAALRMGTSGLRGAGAARPRLRARETVAAPQELRVRDGAGEGDDASDGEGRREVRQGSV